MNPFHLIAVVILAKFPAAGKVKTRLTKAITPEVAAAVHACFLLHVVRRVQSLSPAEVVVYFDPPDARDAMQSLLSDLGPVTLIPQVAGDLGHRIADVATLLGCSHPRVLLLAVDSPDLPRNHLLHCARAMSEAQVVLGLADDGGYWCIGLQNSVDAAALLHANIEWSTDHTARQTLHNAAQLGYSIWSGELWDDVDRPDDLRRLVTRIAVSADADDRALYNELITLLPKDFLKSCHSPASTEPAL